MSNGTAKRALWFHGTLTAFWLTLWPVATIAGWINSVAFVSHLSVVALILASLSAWQGARAEREAE